MRLMHDDPTIPLVTLPPLIKGYLCSRAWVRTEPAWESDFLGDDLFMMPPVEQLDSRDTRYHLKEETEYA